MVDDAGELVVVVVPVKQVVSRSGVLVWWQVGSGSGGKLLPVLGIRLACAGTGTLRSRGVFATQREARAEFSNKFVDNVTVVKKQE